VSIGKIIFFINIHGKNIFLANKSVKNSIFAIVFILNKYDMKTIGLHSPLNSTQLFVLQTFAIAKDEQEREELTSLYLDYIQKKLDKTANEFWDSQKLDNTKMEELMYGHLRSSKR
jgi:asparagine synthetase A